jgi:predicted O-linked N-acetylglucosamine transferase (SPINDLY family)
MAGRVAAGILHAAGLADLGLIVSSHAAYVARAVQLALDPQALAAVRERVTAAQVASPLFDSPLWARNHARAAELLVALCAAGRRHHVVVRSDRTDKMY